MRVRILVVCLVLHLALAACQTSELQAESPFTPEQAATITQTSRASAYTSPLRTTADRVPNPTPPLLPVLPLPSFSDLRLAGTPVPLPADPINLQNAEGVDNLAMWGIGNISQVEWSPDGQRLAVASSIGVLLYNAATLEQLGWIIQGMEVSNQAFSPDGQQLALSVGSEVQVYRLSDGALIQTLVNIPAEGENPPDLKLIEGAIEPHEFMNFYRFGSQRPSRLVFLPDGKNLAVVYEQVIGVWNLADERLIAVLFDETSQYPQLHVRDIKFSRDGAYIGVAFDDGQLHFWRIADSSSSGRVEIQVGEPNYRSIALSPGLTYAASGMEDGSIQVWSLAQDQAGIFQSQALPALTGHIERVRSLVFSPDGFRLASGSNDHTIRTWDLVTGQQTAMIEEDQLTFTAAVSPHGEAVALISHGHPSIWQVSTNIINQVLQSLPSEVTSLAFSPDSQTLATGYFSPSGSIRVNDQLVEEYGLVQLWQIALGTPAAEIEGHGEAIAFTPDGEAINLGTARTLSQWRIADSSRLNNYVIQDVDSWTVTPLVFSPDGSLLVRSDETGRIQLWSMASGSQVGSLAGHSNPASCLAFSPDGAILASSADGSIKLWSVKDLSLIRTLESSIGWRCSLAFSPDGKVLASTLQEAGIQLWDVGTGAQVKRLEELSGSQVNKLAYSPDGQIVAGGLTNGLIRLWSVSTGFQLRSLEGHTNIVTGLLFSPDGRFLASTSSDTTISLWGVIP